MTHLKRTDPFTAVDARGAAGGPAAACISLNTMYGDRMPITIQTPETILEGPFGVELLMKSADTDGRFGLVEHPIAPRSLAGPMHVHKHEDEYSYVLEGELGFQVADDVFTAGPGQLVAKPRGIWHGF
jgi:mannose-6-phosphate isomerase-like protein (cupin superfamily)